MVTGSHDVWARGVVVMADSADSSDLEMFHHSVSWVIHATGLWFDLGVGWLLDLAALEYRDVPVPFVSFNDHPNV